MNKSFQLFLLMGLLVLASCNNSDSSKTTSPALEYTHWQSTLDSIFHAHPASVGIMIHIEAPKHHISWTAASGFSEKGTKKAISPLQPALIASNTKMYISTAILRLVETHKLNIKDPISQFLTANTKKDLLSANYQIDSISIMHLLSHTSGIMDYVDDNYFNFVDSVPMHRWSRSEQIKLAMTIGRPLGKAGETFRYADVNYVLLTEIIEVVTGKPFTSAVRELIDFEKNELKSTWFVSLEEQPKSVEPLVHQYFGAQNWDSYQIDPSWDLYGSGGLAASTKDLALFSQALFNGKIIKDQAVFDLIYTEIPTKDSLPSHYHLGLQSSDIGVHKTYGHGGFWATIVRYIPDLDASISVFILDKDEKALRTAILETFVRLLEEK
jgi:D-alanyl-D-alanine carboxypeptidase